MPAAVVKTSRDERLWERAKKRVQEEYGLSEADGDRYWRLVMGIFRRMKGLRKGLLVLLCKSGDHWREQPRDRYGRWVKENGSLEDWERLLIPDPTPEKCKRIFDELYRREPFYAFNPGTGRRDLLVGFEPDSWHHVCYVPSDRAAYQQAIGPRAREGLRDIFVPERASRIPWIGRVLLDPDEIRVTKHRGVWTYLAVKRVSGATAYGVFIEVLAPYEARFASAYPLGPEDLLKLRRFKPLFKKQQGPGEVAKSLRPCVVPAGLPAAANTGATRGRRPSRHRVTPAPLALSPRDMPQPPGLPVGPTAERGGAACAPRPTLRGAASLGPALWRNRSLPYTGTACKSTQVGEPVLSRLYLVLKGMVRGHYRRDPRTGKWVYVSPHEREQPHAPVGSQGQYEGGQKLDLRPVPNLQNAVQQFRRLYVDRRPLLRALDPGSTSLRIRVIFRPSSALHAVTKDPPDIETKIRQAEHRAGRPLKKAEREKLRVFAPERAARLHWIELVLKDPDEVWETATKGGRHGYLFMADRDPEGLPYVVFLQRDRRDPEIATFVTAYPVEGETRPEEILRLLRRVYRRPYKRPPALKSAGGLANLCRVIRRLPPPGRLRVVSHTASPGWASSIIPRPRELFKKQWPGPGSLAKSVSVCTETTRESAQHGRSATGLLCVLFKGPMRGHYRLRGQLRYGSSSADQARARHGPGVL